MPIYPFENIQDGRFVEVYFGMNDIKVYNGEDGTEVGIWERRFTVPTAGIDTKIDAWNSRQFVEKTANMKGNLGMLFDISRDLSDKRAKESGENADPISVQNAVNKKIALAEQRKKSADERKTAMKKHREKKS